MQTENTSAAISSGLETALAYWFREQCMNPCGQFYLYYRKARPGESMAMPIIAEYPPSSDWKLATPTRLSPARSPQQQFNTLRPVLNSLPILNSEDV